MSDLHSDPDLGEENRHFPSNLEISLLLGLTRFKNLSFGSIGGQKSGEAQVPQAP